MIKQIKEDISIEELTEGLPDSFCKYLKYCRRLEFEAKPNYEHCREMFKELMSRRNQVNDEYFDWLKKKTGAEIPENDYYNYVE